jgi:hypothetical protein
MEGAIGEPSCVLMESHLQVVQLVVRLGLSRGSVLNHLTRKRPLWMSLLRRQRGWLMVDAASHMSPVHWGDSVRMV